MNNEILANVYEAKYPQIIIIYPLIWKHEPHGNWYVSFNLETDK